MTMLAELIRLFPVAVPNIEPHGHGRAQQILSRALLSFSRDFSPQGIFGIPP